MSAFPLGADEDRLVFRTPDPVFASDETLRIVLWNDGAEALLGFTAREVLGRPCHEVIGCRNRARCQGGCVALPSDAPPCAPSFDRELRRSDGEKVWVNVTTMLATPRGGRPVFVHLLRDLTRQRQIEELLRQVVSGAARLTFQPPAATPESPRPAVTAREREVIQLLARGTSTEGIAAQLSITHRTARNHIQNILGKLGVHSRLEAVAYASSRGLL